MSILNVEHLSHGFGDRAIFQDVSFRLLKGEHIGLVGANGEGKSTFMNIITGKLMPDEGKVEWAKNVRVGYLDQHTVLEKGMTIRDVLKSAFSWLYEMEERMNTICDSMGDASEDELNQMMEELGVIQEMMDAHDFYILDSRIEEIGRVLGLEEIGLERDVTELSGGQRQRVAFARALAPNPELLLLDEPFAAIDAKVRQELRSWLREMITRVGITSIFVTHDQDEAIEVADEIIITNHGHIEQAGTPIEIYSQPKTPFVTEFMGSPTRISNITSFHGYEELGEGLHAVVRPEHVSVTKKTEQSRFSSSVEEGVVERVMFRGREVELHVRVHDVLLVANRRLEEASITEGERVNVFIYQVFAFPAGENGTQNVNIVENANIETEKLFYI